MGAALNRKAAIVLISLVLSPVLGSAQAATIVSADAFFSQLSAAYAQVKDYEADLKITRGDAISTGLLSYKSPLYLNIKFDKPKDQVINFDGEQLLVYDPVDGAVLSQTYKKKTPAQLEGLVSSQGLNLWQKNYTIAFLTGPSPVPLEDGSREMVVKLKLDAKGTTSFSQMILSVNRDLMIIRRVEGTLVSGDKLVMDFTDVRTNQNLPDSRFAYTAPPYASETPDWLFDPEQ